MNFEPDTEENMELRVRVQQLEKELAALKNPRNYKANIEAARLEAERGNKLVERLAEDLNGALNKIYKGVKTGDELEKLRGHMGQLGVLLRKVINHDVIPSAIKELQRVESAANRVNMKDALDLLGVKQNINTLKKLQGDIVNALAEGS